MVQNLIVRTNLNVINLKISFVPTYFLKFINMNFSNKNKQKRNNDCCSNIYNNSTIIKFIKSFKKILFLHQCLYLHKVSTNTITLQFFFDFMSNFDLRINNNSRHRKRGVVGLT